MKKIMILIVVLSSIFILFGCSATNEVVTPAPMEETNTFKKSENVPIPNEEFLYEKYVNMANMPVFDMAFDKKCSFDDRTLIMEDSIDNILEKIIYDHYYYEVFGDFTKYMELCGDSETLSITFQNDEKRFHEGLYMKEYTIHNLSTLTTEYIKNLDPLSKNNILEKIDCFALTQYAIIKLDISWKHNAASLEALPQLDDGRYMRYFLLGTNADTYDFKIYEIYWDSL